MCAFPPWHYSPQLKFRRWPVCNVALEIVKNPLMCCVALLGNSKVGRGESHESGIMYATCLGSVHEALPFLAFLTSVLRGANLLSAVYFPLFFSLLLSSLHFCFGDLFRGGETGYGAGFFPSGNGRRGKTAPLNSGTSNICSSYLWYATRYLLSTRKLC